MPIANFPGKRGWGYDGVDLYAPFNAYGEPDDLKHFVNACHGKGSRCCWMWSTTTSARWEIIWSKFGPYFTASHYTPWGDAVNFEEAGSDEVRRFLIDNALMWLRDYHFDGLRLDAVHAFVDRSAIHFLEQLAGEVKRLEQRLGKHFVLIAESDLNDPRIVKAEEAGGYGLDAQWSDDFHHALFAVISGERAGYYADFGSLAAFGKVAALRLRLRRQLLRTSRTKSTAARWWACRGIALWDLCRTTIRSAIAPRANASATKPAWAGQR